MEKGLFRKSVLGLAIIGLSGLAVATPAYACPNLTDEFHQALLILVGPPVVSILVGMVVVIPYFKKLVKAGPEAQE
jgi:hypothetical protein